MPWEHSNVRWAVTADVDFDPLFWVASTTDKGTYYVKIANYGTEGQNVTVMIPGAEEASERAWLQTLTGAPTQSNNPLDVTVLPVEGSVNGSVASGWTLRYRVMGLRF
jgi:alpha-N-arabinofuranosidase